MHVVRQWMVQGNHVGAVPAHPFLAQAGALANAAVHQAGQGASEGADVILPDVPALDALIPGQGTLYVPRGATEEGGGGAVQQHGDVTPIPLGGDGPRTEVQPPPQPQGGGGGGGAPAPVAKMVTCPDASVHPAGYTCPQKASPLGGLGSFLSDWGLWALLGVGAGGGFLWWQHKKKQKAGLGVHDRETIPAWERAGGV